MRSGRPDTIHKNCLNVQEGLVEACDFDPAMCEECEATACKWHPSKLAKDGQHEDIDEEEDDEIADAETDDEPDRESGDDGEREEDDERE